MAVDSATTAGPQPQARSAAEDGRGRVSWRARNAPIRGPARQVARGGRSGEESRRPAVAGSRPASSRERLAALDPPAPGRRDSWSQAVKESRGSGAFSPAMIRST